MHRVGLLALCLFSVGLIFIAQTVQAQETDVNQVNEDAQNWANNWAESWQERLGRRQSVFHKFFNVRISEKTLLSFYGQVNLMYLNYDDGIEPFTSIRDNANSPGRLGIRLETDFDSGASMFLNLETGLRRSTFDSIFGSGDATDDFSDWNRTLLRKAEARFSLPDVGFVSIGQGSMASDGITSFDFSNTTTIANKSVGDTASGEPAFFSDGTESTSSLQSFFPSYDGSRRFRLRYDLPSRNGLSWSTSIGEEVLAEDDANTYADIALRYETKWRRFRVKGGIAYIYNDASPDFLSGSVSGVDNDTGLNFTIAAGKNLDSGQYVYGKLGLIRKLTQLGDTAFSIDYYQSSDPRPTASGSASYGVAVVQNVDVNQTQFFATYRHYSVDGIGVSFQDVDVFAAGVRFTW